MGDLPLPQPSPQGGTKRERDSDSPTLPSRPVSTPKEGPRTIAGTRRISREVHSQSQQPRPQHPLPSHPPPAQLYNLPVYTNDLGRLPLHGQVNFAMTGSTTSTSSGSVHPSNMWFSSLSDGTQPPTNPASPPVTAHGFAQGGAYSLDDLFMDQIPIPFGGFSGQQPHSSVGHGGGSHAAANDLQAFMDAASASGVQPSMMQTNEMLDVDPDTIAMWSSAPTGFGWVFPLSFSSLLIAMLNDAIRAG